MKNRNVVIGTAGHIDHGKSSLIRALTGIETDRLLEEKKRGISIENGFAHLELPDGSRAGVIDVPGHEKFIKNMLAGSGGIDIAMLVIAADDGVMPQTREHLDILSLLGIRQGLVALTKCDLADDPGWLDMLEEEILGLVEPTFLNGAPIVRVSSKSGAGLDELKAALFEMIAKRPARLDSGPFRLPVDRVFSMTGFGTVVTGTLMDGPLCLGETAQVYPGGGSAKVRQLQVHSRPVEKAWPGQRVAVNLAGVRREEVARGNVLAAEGSLRPAMMLDARLSMLPDSPFSLKSGRLVHLYLGAGEFLAKLALLENDELRAGESGYAQLRLMEPLVARRGDRFVIRFYSPVVTVGGGEVLDASPVKRRRHKPEVVEQFETRESGSHIQRVELAIGERPGSFTPLTELLARADLDKARGKSEANTLAARGAVIALTADIFIHYREMEKLRAHLIRLLDEWHKANPYSPGRSLEELRVRLIPAANQAAAEAFFGLLENEKLIKRESGAVRLAKFEPQVNEAENELTARLEQRYRDFAFTPPATSAVEAAADPAGERQRRAAFATLIKRGDIIRLDDLYHIHTIHYEAAAARFKEMASGGQPVEVGAFRDALGTSRKVAVALLDMFDQRGLSRRVGEGRVLTHTP